MDQRFGNTSPFPTHEAPQVLAGTIHDYATNSHSHTFYWDAMECSLIAAKPSILLDPTAGTGKQ